MHLEELKNGFFANTCIHVYVLSRQTKYIVIGKSNVMLVQCAQNAC